MAKKASLVDKALEVARKARGVPKKPVKVKGKKTVPAKLDWGPNIPEDKLAYLNDDEMALVQAKRMFKGKRSFDGVPAFPDPGDTGAGDNSHLPDSGGGVGSGNKGGSGAPGGAGSGSASGAGSSGGAGAAGGAGESKTESKASTAPASTGPDKGPTSSPSRTAPSTVGVTNAQADRRPLGGLGPSMDNARTMAVESALKSIAMDNILSNPSGKKQITDRVPQEAPRAVSYSQKPTITATPASMRSPGAPQNYTSGANSPFADEGVKSYVPGATFAAAAPVATGVVAPSAPAMPAGQDFPDFTQPIPQAGVPAPQTYLGPSVTPPGISPHTGLPIGEKMQDRVPGSVAGAPQYTTDPNGFPVDSPNTAKTAQDAVSLAKEQLSATAPVAAPAPIGPLGANPNATYNVLSTLPTDLVNQVRGDVLYAQTAADQAAKRASQSGQPATRSAAPAAPAAPSFGPFGANPAANYNTLSMAPAKIPEKVSYIVGRAMNTPAATSNTANPTPASGGVSMDQAASQIGPEAVSPLGTPVTINPQTGLPTGQKFQDRLDVQMPNGPLTPEKMARLPADVQAAINANVQTPTFGPTIYGPQPTRTRSAGPALVAPQAPQAPQTQQSQPRDDRAATSVDNPTEVDIYGGDLPVGGVPVSFSQEGSWPADVAPSQGDISPSQQPAYDENPIQQSGWTTAQRDAYLKTLEGQKKETERGRGGGSLFGGGGGYGGGGSGYMLTSLPPWKPYDYLYTDYPDNPYGPDQDIVNYNNYNLTLKRGGRVGGSIEAALRLARRSVVSRNKTR